MTSETESNDFPSGEQQEAVLLFNPVLSSCPLSDEDSNYETVSSQTDTDISESLLALSCDGSDTLSDIKDDHAIVTIEVNFAADEKQSDAPDPNERYLQRLRKSDVGPHSARQPPKNDDEDDDEFDYTKVRRSTSLKTYTTPSPGSPRRKKEVRFADALGLDLEMVRQIMTTDEPPIVPVSALKYLRLRADSNDSLQFRRRLLHACFSQPGDSVNFAGRIAERRIALQNCTVTTNVVEGTIRVANIAFEKRVSVRYTLDGWTTFNDIPATYVDGSNDGVSDQFRFSITLPDNFGSSSMEFSVRYIAGAGEGLTFWDSNFGANYRIECYTS